MTWLWIVLAVLADGLAALVGALVPERWLARHRSTTLGFAAGAMLGAAALDVIPEALASGAAAWLWIAGTIAALATWEHAVARRHHAHDSTVRAGRITVPALLGSDALHNIGDGLAVASAFMVSPRLGVATAAAVIVHEIPQELADYTLLRATGTPKRIALLALAGVQLTAGIGAAAAVIAANATRTAAAIVLAIAAGTFVFIGASLVPHVVRCIRPLLAFAAGVAIVALTACGGTPTALPDIRDRLAALPGVTVIEVQAQLPGYRAFDLWFQRDGFEQYAALLHTGDTAPLVLYTSGYDAWSTRLLTEPARLLHANQISIETRFYGSSQPAAVDWSQLTALATAADAHGISEQLAAIYDGPRIATGASKGGEEALIHAWLYPGDLDGVVAYVAAVSTANPDPRYAGVIDAIGTAVCRAQLLALQRELLGRRGAIETRAAARDAYTIAGVAHATETAIVELEFAFWMKSGEAFCRYLPDPTASDDALYGLLDAISSPAAYSDEALRRYGRAYIFQDQRELGYPVIDHAQLDDLLAFTYEDWSAYLPAPVDRYDPTLPQGLAAWLASGPPRVLFVGGEWDPWRPGYPTLGAGLQFLVPHGTHADSVIEMLEDADRHAALVALDAWAGMPVVQ